MVKVRLHFLVQFTGGEEDEPVIGFGGTTDLLQVRFGRTAPRTWEISPFGCICVAFLHGGLWVLCLAVGFWAYVRGSGHPLPSVCWA